MKGMGEHVEIVGIGTGDDFMIQKHQFPDLTVERFLDESTVAGNLFSRFDRALTERGRWRFVRVF
jgi:hypothetical protein